VDHPQLVVVAMVENAGFGAENALPVVKQVLQVAFGIGETGVAPSGTPRQPAAAAGSSGPAVPGAAPATPPKAGQ